ncbi:MAG: ankyrin repeat domain-containing protein [Proteobacteria bacterium]|nr:ankyrin repeat domain-containing protein [Pseudomonadota bacterium]
MKKFAGLKSLIDEAVENGTLAETVPALLEKGLSLNEIIDKETGDTLLHYLCTVAPLELLCDILKIYPTNVDVQNKQGETPLFQAAFGGRQALISLLMFYGAQPHKKNKAKESAATYKDMGSKELNFKPINYDILFDWQISFNKALTIDEKLALLHELYELGFSLLTPIDSIDNTVLHFLLSTCDLQLIDAVLKDLPPHAIDCQNYLGETPLMQAVRSHKQLLTHLLLRYKASLAISDYEGKSAGDYASENKVTLIPKNISHLLLIPSELSQIFDADSYLKRIEALMRSGIKLTDPIDALDNTLLHLVLQTAPIKAIHRILSMLKPGEIDVQNSVGETPLFQACNVLSRNKIKLLLHHKANPTIENIFNQSANMLIKTNSELKSYLHEHRENIDLVVSCLDRLQSSLLTQTTEEVVNALLRSGIRFDTPLDEYDNTLLHWLIESAPIHVLKNIMTHNKIQNINPQNFFGETPLMKAASLGRQGAVSLLLAHGANVSLTDNLGLTAQDHALNAHSPIIFSPKTLSDDQTVYEYLLEYFNRDKDNIARLPERERAEYLFHHFNRFVQQCGWRYDGTTRDYEQLFLLDCSIKKSYIINCFDLANAFACLLKAYGVTQVSTFVYKNMRSIPFSEKPSSVKGDFVCFDKEVQQNAFKKGYFDFDNHCVVTCQGRFFDPTFCCYYENQDDIVAGYDAEEAEEDYLDIYIGIYTLLAPEQKKLTTAEEEKLLNLKFLSILHQFFPDEHWHHLRRKNKIIISQKKGEGSLEIDIDQLLITFSSRHISEHMLAKIAKSWHASVANTSEVTFTVVSNNPQLSSSLKHQLAEHGIAKRSIIDSEHPTTPVYVESESSAKKSKKHH